MRGRLRVWLPPKNTDWMPLIIAAAIAALIWVWAFAVSHSKAAATFAWAAVCLSAPFVLNSRNLLPAAFVDLFNTIRKPAGGKSQGVGIRSAGIAVRSGVRDIRVCAGSAARVRRARWNGPRSVASRIFSRFDCRERSLLIALAGSLNPWWSDSMMPGRTVLLALPLLAPPIAWLYARAH